MARSSRTSSPASGARTTHARRGAVLTHELLASPRLALNRWITESMGRGSGALVARRTAGGVRLYYRYTGPDRRQRVIPIGPFSTHGDGKSAYTLAQARRRALELAGEKHDADESGDDLVERRRAERDAAAEAKLAQAAAREQAAAEARAGSLEAIIAFYVEDLKRRGRRAAADVRRLMRIHVSEAHPRLARAPAKALTDEQAVDIIATIENAGKLRTAAKVRSYLRAAYAYACKARLNPGAPLQLRRLRIMSNPILGMATVNGANLARDRHLSASELAFFLEAIDELPEHAAEDALRLALLLAGQRPVQLLRVQSRDVDLTTGEIVLYDPKGKRETPRRHAVPLTARTRAIVERRIAAAGTRRWLFASVADTHVSIERLGEIVRGISARALADPIILEAAKTEPREAGGRFQLRDLRRTAETHLIRLGVSSDHRAVLLSHGLTGVQRFHYDRHDYRPEMREALSKWEAYLDALAARRKAAKLANGPRSTAKVVPLGRSRRIRERAEP